MRETRNVEIASCDPHPDGWVVQLSSVTAVNAARHRDLAVSEQRRCAGFTCRVEASGEAPTCTNHRCGSWRWRHLCCYCQTPSSGYLYVWAKIIKRIVRSVIHLIQVPGPVRIRAT